MLNKYSLPLIFFLMLSARVFTQVWIGNYNGPANGDDKAGAVITDASGNVYITGYSTGNGTSKDITTVKFNSSGTQLWAARYNGPGNSTDEAYAITIDASDNIYVTGYSTGNNTDKDIVLIKYNSSGIQQWAARHTSSGHYNDEANAIALDAAGNVYVCGYRYDDNYDNEIVLIKYNSLGIQQWIKDYNGTSNNDNDEAYAITVDGSGNIIITGTSKGSTTSKDYVTIKYNAAGSQQWVKRYNNSPVNQYDEAYAITVDAADNIYVTGYSSSLSGGKDYVTIKYDASGNQQWLSRYNNSAVNSDDIAKAIGVMNNGDIIVTGSSKNSPLGGKEDYLTIKYDPSNGNADFIARYNDSSYNGQDIPTAVGLTSSNSRIFITGSSYVSSNNPDIVTIEYTATGSFKAKYRINNPGADNSASIKVTGNNKFYIGGYMNGGSAGNNMTGAEYNGESFVSITNTGSDIPENYKLNQNYPNPFNPETRISFDVKDASFVKISIYDILGRIIALPVNDFLKAGKYEVSVNLNSQSSGLYFYRMESGSFKESRTMMLIK